MKVMSSFSSNPHQDSKATFTLHVQMASYVFKCRKVRKNIQNIVEKNNLFFISDQIEGPLLYACLFICLGFVFIFSLLI